MRNLIFTAGILLLPILGFSQRVSDSISIFIDNQLEIKIIVEDYENLKTDPTVIEMVSKFQKHLPNLQNQLDPQRADIINYDSDSVITVEEGIKKSIILIANDELTNTGIRDKARLYSNKVIILMETKDIAAVSELPIIDCIKKVIVLLPEKSKVAKSLAYQCVGGKVDEIFDLYQENIYYADAIELSGGMGGSLIKNQWMGDISVALKLSFFKKGLQLFSPYVSTSLLYDFDITGKMNINTFLDLGYAINTAESDEKSKMSAIEFGYLLSRQGNVFDESTFRIGIKASPAKGIFINPQLYMEDGFQRFYPGIRIGFGL